MEQTDTLYVGEELHRVLDNLADVLNVRVTLFSPDHHALHRGRSMPNSDFCIAVQQDPERFACCREMDERMQSATKTSNDVIIYRCHAGLNEAVAPVTVRNRLTAFLMLGQFRIDGDPVPEWITRIGDEHQRQRMLECYESLASFSRARLNGIIGLFRSLIDYVVIRELAIFQEDRLYDNIVNYIRAHVKSEIKLPDMARKLGKSVSTLSQYLRKKHGTSFKTLLTEFRLELVDKFIKEHPDASIAEIAAASGFKDQFYFSRVFKKQRGIAPGVYREQFRGRR